MDSDDIAYRKSVRNMAFVLAAIVITIFAAIFVPPYVNPPHNAFQRSVSYDFGSGLTMYLNLNSTTLAPAGHILFTAWVNSSSDSVESLTAADSWAFPQSSLWEQQCTYGWPVGIGVMSGHYTQDNYTLGTLLRPSVSPIQCPPSGSPQYFLFYPHSFEALASINGNPYRWTIRMSLSFGSEALSPSGLPSGVYTAVFADEWGDVLTANFQVA
jgi:hypothetical protein